jgi:ferric-dicitrate binding protein FerR (iron transport regulator)
MPPEDQQDQQDQQQAAASDDTSGATEPDWKAEADKWKAHSRKHEAQAKSNAEAAKKLAEIEEASKTETQKLTDRASAAEKRAAEAEAKATRYEVAAEVGIKAKHMKYLTGSTREEIEESAKGILADFPETYASSDTDGTPQPTRPKERLRPGAAPSEEPDETDPRKLAASVPRL